MLRLSKTWSAGALLCLLTLGLACGGKPYRSPNLFGDRIISQQKLSAAEYEVYSAALPVLAPGPRDKDWISVSGVTIPAEYVDLTLFEPDHRAVMEGLFRKLNAASDTVYVIEGRFAESLAVAPVPLMDTSTWVPIQWDRTLHRPYPAGLVSFSRVAMHPTGEWALVYGLYGNGPVGTGFPRMILLRKLEGHWQVVESHEPNQ